MEFIYALSPSVTDGIDSFVMDFTMPSQMRTATTNSVTGIARPKEG